MAASQTMRPALGDTPGNRVTHAPTGSRIASCSISAPVPRRHADRLAVPFPSVSFFQVCHLLWGAGVTYRSSVARLPAALHQAMIRDYPQGPDIRGSNANGLMLQNQATWSEFYQENDPGPGVASGHSQRYRNPMRMKYGGLGSG